MDFSPRNKTQAKACGYRQRNKTQAKACGYRKNSECYSPYFRMFLPEIQKYLSKHSIEKVVGF